MKTRFKILFIDALDTSNKFQDSYPPLGIGYLLSYLQGSVKDVDSLVINRGHLKYTRSFKPDLIALSSVSQNFDRAKIIASEIKNYDDKLPVIVGGIHVSQLPESMSRDMDIAVLGEGEETFLQLVRHIQGNSDFYDGLEHIDGIAYWQADKIIRTEEREPIIQLDNIPHPAREKLPNREKQLLLTSRGCPYRCAFCASSFFWKKIRYFSVDYVLDEIRQIVDNYPVLNLTIYDDLFIFEKNRLAEISSKIIKAGYNKKVNFWCLARANHIDEEALAYLKDMNVKGIAMGLESGSDSVLASIKSGDASVEINRKAIDLCHRYGLFVHGSFMLGCPSESEEDMLKTYSFIKESGIDKGDLSLAVPLPGTSFWEYALKEGLASNEMEWSRLRIRNIDEPPSEDCLLLTKNVKKDRFLHIFKEISAVLKEKRNSYDKKWDMLQGREIKLKNLFSIMNFKKILKDPMRGARYSLRLICDIPLRIRRFLCGRTA